MSVGRHLSIGTLFAILLVSTAPLLAEGDLPNLRTERFLSAPLRAEFNYYQVLRCNLVNGSDVAAFGTLAILDRAGNELATKVFLVAPGHVTSLDALTFNYDLRYCRSDVGWYEPHGGWQNDVPAAPGSTFDVVERVETNPFVGSLQVVDGGITTATAELRRVSPIDCDDEDACTLDAYDPVARECINAEGYVCHSDQPFSCPPISCQSVTVQRTATYTYSVPICREVN